MVDDHNASSIAVLPPRRKQSTWHGAQRAFHKLGLTMSGKSKIKESHVMNGP